MPAVRSAAEFEDRTKRCAELYMHSLLSRVAGSVLPVHAVVRCHKLLADLRPPGGKGYVIPRGFAFDYVTCANYMFEVLGWLLFAFGTRTMAAFLFIAAGGGQMALWAKAKHSRLQKVRILCIGQ